MALAFLAAVGAYSALRAIPAGREAQRAKAALLRAERYLSARELEPARLELLNARESLRRMKTELDALGPVLPLSKIVPGLRSQVIAVETFQRAGTRLVDAGLGLSAAAEKVTESTQSGSPLSGVLDKLRDINESLADGAVSVRAASADVSKLEGRWLIGPISDARDDLLERLPRYERQATSTAEGVDALISFVGGEGPRRYLFFSQNPEEIRPTGGFIGTYGVLTAAPGDIRLDQFEPIARFRARHPEAVVPAAEAGSPFRFTVSATPQTMANVNNTADFSAAAKLATDLWNGAGEPPVNGVVSFTPAFLARILGVLGPVTVPEYGERVDQSNLIERFDFYTAQLEDFERPEAETTRKAFIVSLAEVVMRTLLATPSSQWQALGEAVGQGFGAREAMAWSTDDKVRQALGSRGWDGVLPVTTGDFFYNGEFGYETKAGRGLRRDFDHHVELRADGSARVTTVMTITNTRERSPLNVGSLSYVTIYGPAGAVLDPSSDKPAGSEPAVGGHPAHGWFLSAPPLGRASVRVVWEVKNLAQRESGGTRQYSLRWLRVPDHSGDALNLRVDLPRGWQWKDAAPPARVDLVQDVKGTWLISTGSFF